MEKPWGTDRDGQRAVRSCLLAMIFASVFLQRFGVDMSEFGVPFNLFINLGSIGVLTLLQRTNINPIRAALVSLFVAYTTICVVFSPNGNALTSAIFAAAMYLPFALVLRSGDLLFMHCVQSFRSMVLICAVLGIIQFLLQPVISNSLLFTFKDYVPSGMLLRNVNTVQPLMYGSPLYKSNGFFMIEASTFSQYVALAVIIELLFYRMNWRLAVYGAALMFSYSGTGLIVLALAPAILVSRRSYGTMTGLALFALLAMATSESWHMSIFEQRTTEFNSNDTSAYSRFIAPANLIARYQLSSPRDLLFGLGPGTINRYGVLMPYLTHDPAWAKVLFEYGLVGCLFFWPMLITSVFSKTPSIWLSAALMIGFLTFGGEFLDPRLQAFFLVFCTLPKPMMSASVGPCLPAGIGTKSTQNLFTEIVT